MEECPGCETPGPLTLTAWPQKGSLVREGYLATRYYVCFLCGWKMEARWKGRGGPQQIFGSEEAEHMKYLYVKCGFSSAQIAKQMNCSQVTVRKYLREAGVQMRKTGGSQPRTDYSVVQMVRWLYWQEEWTIKQIGEHLGKHPGTIQALMERAGIPRRNISEANRLAVKYGRNPNVKQAA